MNRDGSIYIYFIYSVHFIFKDFLLKEIIRIRIFISMHLLRARLSLIVESESNWYRMQY